MHCGRCEQPLTEHADLTAPCPRCHGTVAIDGRWLLLERQGPAWSALDLLEGVRRTLHPAPSGSLPEGLEAAGPWVVAAPELDAGQLVDLLEPEPLDEALFEAMFPDLPAPAPPPVDLPPDPGPPPSAARRWWRRAMVTGVSVMAAAQLGFAIAPVPVDYGPQAHASAGAESLADQVATHPAVQGCLTSYRRLPVRQSEAPALLAIERTPGMTTPHVRVTSTHPVLAGCLTKAAQRLPLPEGRYAVAVPITESR